MEKRPRMSDVARAAGVSKTTVSLVMNAVPGARIPDATRARVFAAAQELGYAPAPAHPHGDDAAPPLIGVIINEISAAYPINLIDGLQSAAEARDAQLLIQIATGPEQERDALRVLRRLGAAGVIRAMTFHAEVTPPPELAAFRHVFLNCRPESGGSAVLGDEEAAGRAAAAHLLARGARRIATVTGDPWQIAVIERSSGFRAGLAEHGLAPLAEIPAAWGHAGGAAAMAGLLAAAPRPDAVWLQNDIMARGALAALATAGIRCPEDVLIIGHDDREFAADLAPSLTTITLPHAEMAERALALVLDDGPPGVIRIAGELVPRDSTRARI